MWKDCNAILIPVTGDASEHRYSNGDKTGCLYLNEKDHDLSRHALDENYLPHHLYITIDEKVVEGDWGVGYAQGFRGHGAGHFLFKQDGTNVGKLNALCTGVSKVVCSTNPQVHGLRLSPNSDLDYIMWYIKNTPFEVQYEEHYESGVFDCGSSPLWDSGSSEIRLRFV